MIVKKGLEEALRRRSSFRGFCISEAPEEIGAHEARRFLQRASGPWRNAVHYSLGQAKGTQRLPVRFVLRQIPVYPSGLRIVEEIPQYLDDARRGEPATSAGFCREYALLMIRGQPFSTDQERQVSFRGVLGRGNTFW